MTIVKIYCAQHESQLIKTFTTFCEKEDYVDVTFVCKDGNKVVANKIVLSCVSPFLKSLLLEWQGNEEMVTLLLPEVDHRILKLVLDFVYEGRMKLSKAEFKEFKKILLMLDIKLPRAFVFEKKPKTLQQPPPPLAEISNSPALTGSGSNVSSNNGNNLNDSTETSNAVRDISNRKVTEPDDDPLNVPDFYYAPPAMTGETSTDRNQTQSENPQSSRSRAHQLISDENKEKSQMNDSSTASKVGKRTKKRHSQMKSANEKDSDVVQPKRSSGRLTSLHNREVSSTRRIQGQSSDNDSSSGIASGLEHDRKATSQRESFRNLREDGTTSVSEVVRGAKTNFYNT